MIKEKVGTYLTTHNSFNICYIYKLELCNYSTYMNFFVAIELKQTFSLKPVHLLSSSSLGCVLETFTAVRHKHGVSMVTDLHAS